MMDRQIELLKKRIASIEQEKMSVDDSEYANFLDLEQRVYKRIVGNLEFQAVSPIERQAERINILATIKKTKNIDNISLQKDTIFIYEQIITALPYIISLNYNRHNLLKDLEMKCYKILEDIDLNNGNKPKKISSFSELKDAFKGYFKSKPSNIDLFKENYSNIDKLHNNLKNFL